MTNNNLTEVQLLCNKYSVHLYYGNKEDAFNIIKNYFSEFGTTKIYKKDFEGCFGKTFYSYGIDPVVWVSSELERLNTIPILVHEAFHATSFLFDFIEEYNRDEIFALCLEQITSNFLKLYLGMK